MAEVAPAPAAPAKAAKKLQQPSEGTKSSPSVNELILRAVSESKERNGVSLPALKKFLIASGYDVEKNKARVKIAVRSLVTKGAMVQTRGTGASGSFKMNKQAAEPKASKPAAKKAPAAAKKPKGTAAKKSPSKAKKTSAEKKAAKGPKKTSTSPKKAAKKAQPGKKSPVKKAAKPKPRKAAPKKK